MSYKFLIYISYSYAIPIGNPLEKEILKNNYKVKWFSDLDDGKNALTGKKNVLNTIEEVINYQPDIVLAATDDVPDFITGIKVQIFHGFFAQKRPEGNNRFAHFRIRGFFDLYCTQGPSTTSGFLAKKKKKGYFEVIETGWSKVDPLFPLPPKIKTEKPVILIASTFTERLSLAYNQDVFETIKAISKAGKYELLMVLHPKLPHHIQEKWQSLNGENFQFFNTTDLIPLFQKTDILFADTTSVIQEYLVQKKPVVTFRHTFKHNYLIHVNEAKDIENSFQQALYGDNSNILKHIEKFIEQLHPYYDGQSSKRVIEATISFLHMDKSYLKLKPLNLIRKFKIRKRLNYFTLKTYYRAYTKQIN